MPEAKQRRVPIATTLRPEDAARLRALAAARGQTVAQAIRKPVLGWLRRVTREATEEEGSCEPTS
jgi:hypothetical protein